MYQISLNHPIHVHFVGIGGISMSGLAKILLHHQFKISGSDLSMGETAKELIDKGAMVYQGHDGAHVTQDVDLLVYTVAVKQDNPELAKARALNIPIIDRAALLGQVMDHYSKSIAVAGTHGKTTTTSMVSHILMAGGTDPTILVGGILPSIKGNLRVGQTDYFVTEACEYFDSFLNFRPKVAITLNLEEDHLDYFKDKAHIEASFHQFHKNIHDQGLLLLHETIDHKDYLTKNLTCRIATYNQEGQTADYTAKDIHYSSLGFPSFTMCYHGKDLGTLTLSVPGNHNIGNALAAAAATLDLGLPFSQVAEGIAGFTGTNRRFQYKGQVGGILVVDDYAHHPTEIEATIQATKNMSIGKLHIVFQPHTYSRTKALFDDFAKTLSMADHVYLLDIYSAAREVDPGDIHSEDLVTAIKNLGTDAVYCPTIEHFTYEILTKGLAGDLLITMGAGDVYLVGESLVSD